MNVKIELLPFHDEDVKTVETTQMDKAKGNFYLCEEIFERWQNIDEDRMVPAEHDCRSLSVGDMIKLENCEDYFIVDNMGFAQVSEGTAKQWRNVPSRDRLMGFDWVAKQVDILTLNHS